MLMVEGMNSQLSTLGPMLSVAAMLPTMLNSSPSGITTQNNFFLKSLFGHGIVSKQQKSSLQAIVEKPTWVVNMPVFM